MNIPETNQAVRLQKKIKKIPGFVLKHDWDACGIISPKLMIKNFTKKGRAVLIEEDFSGDDLDKIGRLVWCPKTHRKMVVHEIDDEEEQVNIQSYFQKQYNYRSNS